MALAEVEIRGLEPSPVLSNPGRIRGFSEQATQNATYDVPSDLQQVISAWPKLGSALRAAVIAVVYSRDNK